MELFPKMSALERHYTSIEVAKLWKLSDDTVRAIFKNVPGVLKIVRPETRNKRGYTSYRIPESVVQKVHAEMRRVA
jgi:hypothetical protein